MSPAREPVPLVVERVPMPKRTAQAITTLSDVTHLRLRLSVFLPERLEDEDERTRWFRRISSGPEKTDLVESGSGYVECARELVRRRLALLKMVPGAQALALEQTEDYTTGLKAASVLENGLALAPPYGLPCITSAAIKGVCASHIAEMLCGALNVSWADRVRALHDSGFEALFGTSSSSGAVQFFDALPRFGGDTLTAGGLRVSGTTPHHRSWYRGEAGAVPDGTEQPQPVPFLTVMAGTRWLFAFAVDAGAKLPALAGPRGDEWRETFGQFGIAWPATDVAALMEAVIVSAARYHGFGSQVNRGYGRLRHLDGAKAGF